MSSLIITKQSGNFFSLSLDNEPLIISEANRLTTIGDFCNFKTATGANLILKQNILYSEITVVSTTSQVPVSINNLWTILISVGFFTGLSGAGGGSATRFDSLLDTFQYFGRNGQLLIVNESELKLDTVAFQVFTEAEKLKLNGIEIDAQKNVQSNWNELDITKDSYIIGKPSFGITRIFDTVVTVDGTQVFSVNADTPVRSVYINGEKQFLSSLNTVSVINTYTQVEFNVTLAKPTKIDNYIYIEY